MYLRLHDQSKTQTALSRGGEGQNHRSAVTALTWDQTEQCLEEVNAKNTFKVQFYIVTFTGLFLLLLFSPCFLCDPICTWRADWVTFSSYNFIQLEDTNNAAANQACEALGLVLAGVGTAAEATATSQAVGELNHKTSFKWKM